MPDIFVAFYVDDIERGNRIVTFFVRRGYRVHHSNKQDTALNDEEGGAPGIAKCVVALWSEVSAVNEYIPSIARFSSRKRVLINVLLEHFNVPSELDFSEALDLTGWDGNEDESQFELLADRVRKITGIAPKEPSVSTALSGRKATIPACEETVPKELIQREARLSLTCNVLLGLFWLLFFGVPLGACIIGLVIKLSDGWVVFWAVGGTVAAIIVSAIREAFDHRRECAREALIAERAKCDPRPFCLLLRSFIDPVLGYGLYFTEVGDKRQRHYEGPVRFRETVNGLAKVGRLLVLCRGTNEDAILRTEKFEHIGLRAPNERWLQFFKYASSRCRAIVVVPGASSGLLEEIRIIQSEPSLLRKTLVFMPHTPPDRLGSTFYFELEKIGLAWTRIQQEWSSSGLQLPDYRKTGLVYFPRADFSVDRTRQKAPLSGPATLSDIVSADIPMDENMCSSAEMLRAADSHGVTWLQTAKAGARERFDIAMTMLVLAVATALFWWLTTR